MMMRRFWIGCTFAAISLATFGWNASIGVSEDPIKPTPIEIAGGTLTMESPAGWKRVESKGGMIKIDYEFRAPADAKEEEQARVTIMQSGGGIQANVDRWKGQFDNSKDEDIKIEKKEIAGQTVHMVDIKGTFKDSMGGGPFAPGPMKKRENYRMLGLIIETKANGTYFVKMTGPQATVEKQAEGWKKMAEGMKGK